MIGKLILRISLFLNAYEIDGMNFESFFYFISIFF